MHLIEKSEGIFVQCDTFLVRGFESQIHVIEVNIAVRVIRTIQFSKIKYATNEWLCGSKKGKREGHTFVYGL